MKTWIFDEQALDTAIAAWIENQIASGHPKAVANAAFVGRAIKDMLDSSPKLFKESKPAESSTINMVPSKPFPKAENSNANRRGIDSTQQLSNFSIAQMKKAWYGDET